MGKHSPQRISYWEARRRRRDLRKKASAKSRGPKRHSPIGTWWFVLFFIVGIALGTAIGFYAKPIAKLGAEVYLSFKESTWKQPKQEQKKIEKALATVSADPSQSVNTLVMGSDAGSNKGEGGWCRSDVMMLVCLQEREKRAVVISIPRDTKVELPGYGTQKINAAHSFGGPSGAIQAVKALTGIDVHHYISMEFNGFKKIVNALDGVPIHLNNPINDPHAGYLPAGDLKLDGEQALVVVRSRRLPNGDVDRIGNQQAFIKALMNKAEQMKSVWKAKELVDIVASNCKMDYSAGQLMNLADELRGFNLTNVQFTTVPGDAKYISGASYYVANAPLIAQIATEVKTSTQLSPELMAKLQAPDSRRVEELNAPNADAISVLSGWKTSAWAVPTVAEEPRQGLRGEHQTAAGPDDRLLPS
jgi:LCP family protein required for cell wall assembly